MTAARRAALREALNARPGSTLDQQVQVSPMRVEDLDAVLDIEGRVYDHPWTRGNFIDSLAAGHPARVLRTEDGRLLGYVVVMLGYQEAHLLNISVAADMQGQGHGRRLMATVFELCREHHAAEIWLEVRAGNLRARRIYERTGFHPVGLRKGYYPAGAGQREDAVLMSRSVPPATGAHDGLE